MGEEKNIGAFQYKAEDRSATFADDAIWEGDNSGRKETAQRFHKMLSGQERPLTICLNGAWGSGKTFFLTRFDGSYNSKESNGRSVYFNAWQDDFLEDPLLAIVCQLKKVASKGVLARLYKSLQKAALPCMVKIALSAAKQATKNKLGVDVDAVGKEDVTTELESAYEQYKTLEKSRKALRDALTNFAAETWKETQKPLLFIIDELDRCRPTFAIEVLERIKHLFSVPHLVFVIGADVKQLGQSIKAVYGDIDVHDYLHRFFDLEVKLPPVDPITFVHALWAEHGLEAAARQHGVTTENQKCTIDEFVQLIKFRNLSLRQIEKCVRTYAFLAMSSDTLPCQWGTLAAIAVVLKVTDPDAYDKFVRMEFSLGELLNYLYPGVTHKEIDGEQAVFSALQHLNKIAYYGDARLPSHRSLNQLKKAIDNKSGVAYDALIMPKSFETCTSDEIVSFYQSVFGAERQCEYYDFKGVPKTLGKMNDGLQFLGK